MEGAELSARFALPPNSRSYCGTRKFADVFGAEPWVAVKFKGHEWYFVSLEDLKDTGNGFSLNVDGAKSKGLLFEEMLRE